MVPIADLWLPIILATVLCFIAGSLLHMVMPIHKRDWSKLPNEDAVLDSLRKGGAGPGNYLFPHATSMEAMKDPAFVAKLESGPCGIMTVRVPGMIRMGPYLTKQFFFHLVVSGTLAYLASRSLAPGADYWRVFQVVGTTGMLAYVAAIFPAVIWYSEPRNYVLGKVVDGVVWGLLSAGSFAEFWPG
jgi:hypothetical protein